MATKRSTYHHGDLRNALMEAALEVVEEHGIEGFTLREAARRVGVNHRAAYRHFADKQGLLVALAEEGYWALIDAIERELAAPGLDAPRDRLLAIGRTFVQYAVKNPARYRIMFGPRLNEDGSAPQLEVPIDRAFRVLLAEITRAAPGGRLSPDAGRDRTVTLWAAMHGFASLVMMKRVRVRRELLVGYSEQVLEPLVRGLTT